MRRLLNYPGSKWRLADLIVENMPKHKAYLEPFCGSGAVFFSKDKAIVETINDYDGRLVNFFRVTRDQPENLQYLIRQTLYSREEFELSIEKSDDPLEDARRMAVRLWFGVGGKTAFVPGFRKSISWNGPYTAYEWNDMSNRIGVAAARLKDAQIENIDAIKLIKQHNNKDTLIYCDPPYVKRSLVDKHYLHDYTNYDHFELLEALLDHKGKVMISGYDTKLYRGVLKDWPTLRRTTKVGITSEKKSDREEVVWCNFELSGQLSIFS